MRLSSMIHQEHYRLWESWEQKDNSVEEGSLELNISIDSLVFWRHVAKPNIVQSIIIAEEVDCSLTEKRQQKPEIENSVGSSSGWNLLHRFSVWKEVEINSS